MLCMNKPAIFYVLLYFAIADQIESFAYNDLQKDESLSSRQSSPSTTLPDSLGERIDVDLVRMESLMDKWCLQLKRNVLVCEKLFLLQYFCWCHYPVLAGGYFYYNGVL